MKKQSNTKKDWDEQWDRLDKSLFGRICSLYRKIFISRLVAFITNKYFPKKGVFVEAGCGTCESSSRIRKYGRELVPVDISKYILKINLPKNFLKPVVADIRNMPFKSNSIDGIWNLGVMEHFTKEEFIKILNEFHRVLKKGSYAILFIPPVFGSSEIVLRGLEFIINIFRKKKFTFMTEELTPVRSKRYIASIIKQSKLKLYRTHFSIRDLFTYYVIVCKKFD